ncbi:MAG: superoxide dismutase family protein [Pseudomonadota bacterium]|jgi:Cu/Zn superoxide dismutase
MRMELMIAGTVLSLAAAAAEPPAGDRDAVAHATFVDAKGERIGTATLSQAANGVLIALDVKGLPPGEHAFHVHGTGRCEPKTGFKSAGDHYAPRGRQHGFHAARGPHAGDMPNVFVQQDGTLRAHVLNTGVTLDSGTGSLFDSDGSALVIHGGADDYRSQPSGNAGDRIACAVVEKHDRLRTSAAEPSASGSPPESSEPDAAAPAGDTSRDRGERTREAVAPR